MSTVRAFWLRRPTPFSSSLAFCQRFTLRLLMVAGTGGLLLFALGFQGDGWQWPDLQDPMVYALRLPRVLAALLVGGALAAAGAALQALFRNPLADPTLIGTSSGAALAVVAVMALGLGSMSLPLAAFAGALLTTWVLLGLARLMGGGEISLLLIGLLLGSLASAATGILLFLSDDLTLRSAMVWLSGQLGSTTGAPLLWAAPVAFLGIMILVALGRDLDCLLLGEDDARSLGVPVERVRVICAIGAALAVGAAVSVSGIIGFIGMMVPNACALVLGGGRRKLIIVSTVVGALFLLGMDTLARGVAYPVNLPVGLLVGFIGPAFFLWLFRLRRRGNV
ncbi:FecCD family ABC transporter permease [Chitinimonas sp. PSY-7]|uniref:iron chelate uptake ABC transporter family permease subunit n=1 Tax=Chitinimonas sp. PSY-7 TaxID=3459088 RepID=UPI00403FFB17